MRTFLLLLLTTVLLTEASPVLAQKPAKPKSPRTTSLSDDKPKFKSRQEKMTADLGLTPKQVARVTELDQQLANQVATLRKLNHNAAEMAQRRERAQEYHDNHDRQLQTVLTPEQYEKYLKQRGRQR